MAFQRHLVVLPQSDGGVTIHPMKEWLRRNPDVLPGIDPTISTSHQLRGMLRAKGWSIQETPSEVRIIPPEAGASNREISEVLGGEGIDAVPEEDEAPYFSLEYQLRDFIASNIGTITISNKRLRLFVDQTGRDGIEYPTAVGPIDILATDETGAIVVFELKKAASPDRAMGQLARYMGWVRQTIGRDREVLGIIVARTITENLRYAASIVPNVSLYEYELAFTLKQANGLP